MTETQIQKEILDYLFARNIFAWRNNTGRKSNISFGLRGSSDIIGILPNGLFLAIEVKKPGNRPKPEQFEFMLRIHENGGCATWGTSLEEVIPIIDEYLRRKLC